MQSGVLMLEVCSSNLTQQDHYQILGKGCVLGRILSGPQLGIGKDLSERFCSGEEKHLSWKNIKSLCSSCDLCMEVMR